MFNIKCLSFTIGNESNCLLFCNTVRIIEISPKTFNISRIVDIFNNIHLVFRGVTSSEMIESLSLPDG